MLRSMTGYGRGHQVIGNYDITVEVKSVNHRYFEFSSRIPKAYQFLEEKIKTAVQNGCSRGKVEASVSIQLIGGGENEVTLNVDITRGYLAALRSSAGELDLLDDLRLSDLVQFPDIFTVRKRELDPEEVWEAVRGVAEEAVNSFVRMREREGRQLKEDLVGRLENIAGTLSFIEERAPVLKEEYYNRLYQKITELLADKNIDETRLVTEAAIFADRVAIDEETVRLRSHLKQFAELLETDQPVGRKLDFLVQEMNRETNTIGSKCQDVDITRRVVDIKSEIEKIREQIQNLE
ncbi:MAG TPA: YicC family protein [Candidatus Faecivivens stercorigallinarum]|nr:YicC family protein [Candidatus Faecivivens stercorigallinarum]